MKSYTDLEQSKKLAEILPIESADMEYMFLKRDNSKVSNVPFVKDDDEPEWPNDSSYDFIPCWSLAALLGALPEDIIVLGTIYSINIYTKNKKWFINYKCNNEEFIGAYSNIFINVCYEMILKLYEQNKL